MPSDEDLSGFLSRRESFQAFCRVGKKPSGFSVAWRKAFRLSVAWRKAFRLSVAWGESLQAFCRVGRKPFRLFCRVEESLSGFPAL
jgi:hypothetical protein